VLKEHSSWEFVSSAERVGLCFRRIPWRPANLLVDCCIICSGLCGFVCCISSAYNKSEDGPYVI